jgi:phosphoadenosine phosphosulfate reductase
MQLTLSGKTIIQESIELIQQNEPKTGYLVAFSGGKDSTVVLDLVKKSGVKYKAVYSLTSVDPPELVKFIKDYYPDVEVYHPKYNMWELIEKKMIAPTRIHRFCCEFLKEGLSKIKGYDITVTGVRGEESSRRSKYHEVSENRVAPILRWSLLDIWDYIESNNLPWCKLYETRERIGCIMCPMQGKGGMKRDAEMYPKYTDAYKRTFQRVVDKRKALGKPCSWDTGEEMFDWWVNAQR